MLPSMSGFLIFSTPENSKHKSESRHHQPSRRFHTRLSMLHQEVKACEYEDVQIMWEMLTRSETEVARYPPRSNRVWKFFSWARLFVTARPLLPSLRPLAK